MPPNIDWWDDDGGASGGDRSGDDEWDERAQRESGEYEAKLGGADRRLVRAPEDGGEVSWCSRDAERLLTACTGPSKVDVLATCTGLPRVRALRALCELCEHGVLVCEA